MAHAAAEQPEDFVIATGRQESVRRFIELTAQELEWGPMHWHGEGTAEVGRRGDTGEVVVRIDSRYFRPAEVDTLLGDPSKAREKLGWTPTTTLEELVAEMLAADVEDAKERGLSKEQRFCCSGGTGMTLITPSDRFAVFGARGMAGTAIGLSLQRAGYSNQLKPSRAELDLLDQLAVQQWFNKHHPSVVVLAAAKVGGIQANNNYRADFLLDNLKFRQMLLKQLGVQGCGDCCFWGVAVFIQSSLSSQSKRNHCLVGHWSLQMSVMRSPRLLVSTLRSPTTAVWI